jgi:hypothetical protein
MAYKIYEGLNVIFEMKGPFAKLATKTERKTVAQAALREGGEWFRVERIPLRFTDWVYRNGYRVTDAWKQFKRRVLKTGRALPFIGTTPAGGGTIKSIAGGYSDGIDVHNAEKMAVAMSRGCRVDITGTSKGGDILIRTPYGHPIQPAMADAFKTVAPEEYQRVAQIVAAAFREFLATAKMKGGRSKKLTIEGANSAWVPRAKSGPHGRDTGTITHRRSA